MTGFLGRGSALTIAWLGFESHEGRMSCCDDHRIHIRYGAIFFDANSFCALALLSPENSMPRKTFDALLNCTSA
jgi:hypothetical protein